MASLIALSACDSAPPGPDLRLTSEPAVTLNGEWHCASPHHLRISNHGRQPAYSVVLLQTVTTGRVRTPVRIYPGPAAGEAVMALVCQPALPDSGWCVEARLQRLADSDPVDADPSDNRWCADSTQSR